MKYVLIAALIIATYGLVGSNDYEDAQGYAKFCSEMVAGGHWPEGACR